VLFCRKNNVPILGTPSSLFYLAILDRCVFTHKKAKFYDIKRTKVAQPYWFKEDITVLLDLLNTKKSKLK
jgi:hypothetical protein